MQTVNHVKNMNPGNVDVLVITDIHRRHSGLRLNIERGCFRFVIVVAPERVTNENADTDIR